MNLYAVRVKLEGMLASFYKSWWFWPLFFGVFLRIVLSPITYHPDILGHASVTQFFVYEGITNPYSYLSKLPQDHPLVANFGVSDIFIYPPLAYFTLGILRFLVSPFTSESFIPELWNNLSGIYDSSALFWHLFFFKLPYVFIDIFAGFFLAGLFSESRKKYQAFALWMFNPVTLYATFMMGQFDALPTLFVILGLYLIKLKKPTLGLLSLGIGGSFKMFPLLLIIPAALFLSQKTLPRIKLVLIGFLPFMLSILPYIFSPEFRQMVLFSPKNQKMLFMILKMTSAEGIYIFVFVLSLLYLYSFYVRELRLWKVFLAILLLIFSVTHFHPQWFLWASPLLIYELVTNRFANSILVLVIFLSWVFITLTFEASLSVGLFAPLNHKLSTTPGLEVLLGQHTDLPQLKSFVRSVFAACCAFLVYRNFISVKKDYA